MDTISLVSEVIANLPPSAGYVGLALTFLVFLVGMFRRSA